MSTEIERRIIAMTWREIECRVVTALVEAMIGAGYRLAVDRHEEDRNLLQIFSDARAVLDCLFDEEEDFLVVFGKERPPIGWIRLVYGEGEEVINDFSDVPEIAAIVDQVMGKEVTP
jgi:hypothetical protein